MDNFDIPAHWNTVYENKPTETLGWYETDLKPSLSLIEKCNLEHDARILNIGAGTTTLIEELINGGYKNLLATDISKKALELLSERVGADNIDVITDDLTSPNSLTEIEPVDLWFDRAVLHFLTKEEERRSYFELLKHKVKSGGFVVLAQFAKGGAEKCSGLPVYQYDIELMQNNLGADFMLLENFDYTYIMPSGAERPYVYALFQRA